MKPIEGKITIREMFVTEFNSAKMTCIPENIFEDGEWAILEWKDLLGLLFLYYYPTQNSPSRTQSIHLISKIKMSCVGFG